MKQVSYTEKSICGHGHQRVPPSSAFVPSSHLFVSVVGPLQVWSHHGHEWVGGWCGCRCSRCPCPCTLFRVLHHDKLLIHLTLPWCNCNVFDYSHVHSLVPRPTCLTACWTGNEATMYSMARETSRMCCRRNISNCRTLTSIWGGLPCSYQLLQMHAYCISDIFTFDCHLIQDNCCTCSTDIPTSNKYSRVTYLEGASLWHFHCSQSQYCYCNRHWHDTALDCTRPQSCMRCP